MPDFEARRPDFAEMTRAFIGGMPAFETLGLVFHKLEPGRAEIRMQISRRVTFDGVRVQGGIVGAMLDITGGAAAMTLLDDQHGLVSLGYETHHVALAGGDELQATARVVKPGRNQTLSLVEIHAVAGNTRVLCATGHVTTCWVSLPEDGGRAWSKGE